MNEDEELQQQNKQTPEGTETEGGGAHTDIKTQTEPSSKGPLVGIIIVIVILVIAAIFVLGRRIPSEPADTNIDPAGEEDAQTSALENQRQSDTINAIEEDVNATELEGLDRELDLIESELESVL